MFTMKIYEGTDTFKNVEDAIKFMKETNYEKDVSVYDIDSKKAYQKTKEIYDHIKEYNKGKNLNDQILPGNPFAFRGILGCLGVQVYTVSLGTYERNHQLIALFTGYNDSVLDTSVEPARIVPSIKALASLALIGQMMEK